MKTSRTSTYGPGQQAGGSYRRPLPADARQRCRHLPGRHLLIKEAEQPYHFTVDVQVPADWQSVFDFELSFADEHLLDRAFRREFSAREPFCLTATISA